MSRAEEPPIRMIKNSLRPVLRAMIAALLFAGPASADIDQLLSLELDDGPDSQQALDSSGTENHAQLGSTADLDDNDPQWIDDGSSGKALHFDGGDFLKIANPCCLEPDSLTL